MTSPPPSEPADVGTRPKAYWLDLIRRHGIRPDKRLGQNFLLEPGALQRVVRAAELQKGETVLEIGAGIGSLTLLLAHSVSQVVAVEFDRRLAPALQESVGHLPWVRILAADILSLELSEVMGRSSYVVVANIPYNITSAVVRKLMESRPSPERVVLTVQREVAERIVAGPGSMSLLALGVQVYGSPSIQAHLPPGAFYPPPSVASSVLRIDLFPVQSYEPRLLEAVFRLARAGFGQKRKQLHNALNAGLHESRGQISVWLEAAGIEPERRAQELSVEEWGRLAAAMLGQQAGGETARTD